jgi:hypothetical protein
MYLRDKEGVRQTTAVTVLQFDLRRAISATVTDRSGSKAARRTIVFIF